ncbi:MAG: HlyD family efflux transporter periplasmic adaptor subunit [Comamonadaceae bacterium]|nr:HlyD family efflux transporter periplasmic adaptor subunit [Comamonadaceae bacterium]
MNAALPQAAHWESLDRLVARARGADTEAALFFCVANDSHALLPYRAALVFEVQAGSARFVCQSGLTSVDRRGAYGSWCEQVAQALLPRVGQGCSLTMQQFDAALHPAWQEYWPEVVYAYALPGPRGQPLGLVIYLPDQAWSAQAGAMFGALHQAYGLCLQSLRSRRRGWFGGARADGRPRRTGRFLLAGLVLGALVLCIPVRQFVVAPAEIISLDAVAVTAPVEGIVAELVAKPNQAVKKGDALVRLDDTSIRNRLDSARQALEVARAEYLAGAHRAFVSSDKTSETGVLRGRISERLSEVAFLQEQLGMQTIRALREGIAVYGQENDWIGKPVAAGQRIMELADASKLGVQVWVPVADAINLDSGAPLSLLLHSDPLNPLQALIEQASYQAVRSPDGVTAYRVRARLAEASRVPRLGLRGSAKIDGQMVPLGYFLLRRPLAVARQWLGV